MTESRWSSWSRGTAKRFGFIAFTEAAMPSQDPAEKARQMGLVGMPFGWFKDPNTGQLVARSIGGELVMYDKTPTGPGGGSGPLDTGNPTNAASGVTPADRARQMGLQSDGSGNYVDSTGQTVARTVNNELVFYDPRGSGGSIADGSGGAQLTQSAPSWVDPVSGLIIVPPAQPESPEEINSVPDPTPATPPMGYDKFVEKKRLDMHKQAKAEEEVAADIQQKQQQVDQFYNDETVPSMQELRDGFISIIRAAEQSGDEYKMAIASLVTDKMNDNAQDYHEYFSVVPEEDHTELGNLIIRHAVSETKNDYFNENLADEYDQALNSGDYDGAKEILSKNSYDHFELKNDIDEMVDSAKGVVDIQDEDFEGRYVGNGIAYNVGDEVSFNFDDEADNEDKKVEVMRAANDVARQYGIKNPKRIADVEWGTLEKQAETKDDAQALALGALQTWRKEVLPDLPVGLVVSNKPKYGGRGGNIRGRIYSMIGFSPILSDYDDRQFAIVVQDGDKKVLKPVNPQGEQVQENWRIEQITNALIDSVDLNNPEDVMAVYEGLFYEPETISG